MNLTDSAPRALTFGSARQYFAISTTSIWGTQVTPDTLLAILGIFNKLLDYLVDNALEHISLQTLTLWMIQKPGAHTIDYEMKEELVKPWIAMVNNLKRWRLFGWKGLGWRGTARFILTLASSICFLLLGAATNTIGIPKGRWYPDLFPKSKANDALMMVKTTQMDLVSLDWMSLWNAGWDVVGSGPQSWVSAVASASASTYSVLGALNGIYAPNQKLGWCGIPELGNTVTALNNSVSGSTVELLSIHTSFIVDLYESLQRNGPKFAKLSSGLMGTVGLTLPQLTTTCSPVNNLTVPKPDIVNVGGFSNSTTSLAMNISFGPNAAADFGGAECAISLHQVVFPVSFWYNGPSIDGLNLLNHGFGSPGWMVPRLITPVSLPSTQNDADNLQQLGIQFSSMLSSMDGLLAGSSLNQHLVLAAQKLRITQPSFESDTASLASVVAITLQHLITVATWNMTPSPTNLTMHYPLRWYVCGSGPRLRWEWAIGLVLCFFLVFLAYDVYLILYYRISPGPWLTLEAMMAAGNTAPKMESIDGSTAGIVKEKAKTAKYYVRNDGVGDVKLCDDVGQEEELVEKMAGYGEGRMEYLMDSLNACAQRRCRS